MFFSATAQFVIDESKKLTGIRVAYLIDEYNTTLTLADLGLDEDNDGVLTDKERAKVVSQISEGFSQYGYFAHMLEGKRKVEFAKPTSAVARLENMQLGVVFDIPLAAAMPLKGKALNLQLYDPTFFTQITMEMAPLIVGPSDGCAVALKSYEETDETAELQEFLSAISREEETGERNFGVLYADTTTLNCTE